MVRVDESDEVDLDDEEVEGGGVLRARETVLEELLRVREDDWDVAPRELEVLRLLVLYDPRDGLERVWVALRRGEEVTCVWRLVDCRDGLLRVCTVWASLWV